MTNVLNQLFSTASNARRAARREGVQFSHVTRNPDSRWQLIAVAPVKVAVNTTGDQLGGEVTADVILLHAPVKKTDNVVRGVKLAHKEFACYDRSSVVKPLEFVRSFLNAHPDLSRKDAVHALVKAGINYATARTQYQRWFSNNK